MVNEIKFFLKNNELKNKNYINEEIYKKINEFNELLSSDHHFNQKNIKIISNDFLYNNYVALMTFLAVAELNIEKLKEKINYLNNLNLSI